MTSGAGTMDWPGFTYSNEEAGSTAKGWDTMHQGYADS
jgi:hypothetical protein